MPSFIRKVNGFPYLFEDQLPKNKEELRVVSLCNAQTLRPRESGILSVRVKLGTFILIFISFLVIWAPTHAAETQGKTTVNCEINHGPCTRYLSGRKVTLDIEPKPVRAMKDLTFTVRLTGEKASPAAYIDLGMPGMNMGPNRVRLKVIEEGLYRGVGVIVRCPSGRRTWRAKVTVPDLGSAEFIFDFIY
jgi:hypothetical protein